MTTKTEAKPAARKVPAEWKDDVQMSKAQAPGDREHVLDRSCWCQPRLVSLPAIVKGSSESVQTVHVRHR